MNCDRNRSDMRYEQTSLPSDTDKFIGSVNVRSFVRPVQVCLELLFFIFWHQIPQDDFRMTSGQSQVSLRSVSGQSQVSLRSVSGLSVLTSSERRSLKYFVLLLTNLVLHTARTRNGIIPLTKNESQ